MDLSAIRKEYPQLQMVGGVDKLKIAKGGSDIDAEITKVGQLIKQGGYVPSFDHSVPPIVSYQNYETYIKKLNDAVQISF